jgi:hypothetical protein
MATRGQPIDWEDLAHDRGFKNDQTMLESYYVIQQMSQEEIGLEIGVCAKTVSDRMKGYGITVRRNGSKPGEKRGPRLPK